MVKRMGVEGNEKWVSQVPVSDFPREVSSDGLIIEPGTAKEYNYVFSNKRADSDLKEDPFSPRFRTSAVEDGSSSFCNACKKPGVLQCCDHCPRTYHPTCLSPSQSALTTKKWMCPQCFQEQIGFPSDLVDGESALNLMNRHFQPKASDKETIRLLAMVYEMIQTLISYDFGIEFANPVTGVEGYTDIVKKPMDLGTVLKQLGNGYYRSDDRLENILICALNDVELVWQNCFLFNHEKSAIFRMARVQQRRADAIRIKSFDHLLSKRVKDETTSFRQSWERINQNERQTSEPSPRSWCRTRTILSSPNNLDPVRRIGVLNPETRRLVQVFSSRSRVRAAWKLFLRLNYECEHTKVLKRSGDLIEHSNDNPNITVFGWRWVSMDMLLKGRVVFPSNTEDTRSPSRVMVVHDSTLSSLEGVPVEEV